MNAMDLQPAATIITGDITGDDGFVEVKLEELSPVVQAAVNALTQEYEVKALKYNAEKQLTKVVGTSKEDKSEKTFILNEKGEEVKPDAAPAEKEVTEVPLLL
jgi:hypothetical protein